MASPEERLKGSFLLFLAYVWTRVLKLPKPTRVQKDIADFLANGPRRRFIAAFRGVGKTFMVATYIVWRLWREPDLKIMVVSANERFAHKIAAFIHTLIGAEDIITRTDVPWAELRAGAKQKDSTLEFDVGPAGPSKDPSVAAFGITGQMTGGRGDVMLFDDVEVPKNSETEALREKLTDRMGEAAAIIKPGGEVIVLGTFQSMQSIYRGLRAKGYTMRLWPARYPAEDKLALYEDTLAPLLKADIEADPSLTKGTASTLGGAPTDPQRFHEEDLMEREAEWGRAGFQLQFMLDTSLTDADRYPLKTSDLIVMDVPQDVAPVRLAWGRSPEAVIKDIENVGFDGDRVYRPMFKSDDFAPFTGSALHIDPSGRGADETAFIVTKFLNGQVYVRRWGGFVDGHSEATLAALARIAFEEKVNVIGVEANFGDGMFSRLLEPHLRRTYEEATGKPIGPPILDHKVSGQKELRIMAVTRPAIKAHRVVLDASLAQRDIAEAREDANPNALERSALYQLTHLTEARGSLRKDDRIDVLSHALTYWAEHMNADAKEAEDRIAAKAARDFEAALFGSIPFKPGRMAPSRGRGRRSR